MRIRLLGDLDVISRNQEPVRFATRKSSLLFAALVLAGRRGHRREQVAEAFWPGRSDAQARNSMRQALVDIRRSFPNDGATGIKIEGDQETITLTAGVDEADVWIFDRKIEEGRPTDLTVAADLYRGDVLAGVVPDGLEEWFGPYQSTYQRKALRLVERLSLTLPTDGSAEEAACESLAERLLASDLTAEPAHRALIRVHAHRGHENAALRQFEQCRAVLKKHLGVEPEAQTSSLAASLRAPDGTKSPTTVVVHQIASHTSSVPASHYDRPSVAVLPFQNLSGDQMQEYFADGIVEDIITALAQFRHLFVIARNSSFTFRERAVDIKQIGIELGVRYIVEGSVRKAGERLRITPGFKLA